MAGTTSGSFSVNATYTTSGNIGDYVTFSWNRTGYSSNTPCYSDINWSLVLHSNGAGYISSSASKSWSVTINGSTYSGTNTIGIGNNTSKTLASGSTRINHNDDGTKTFSVSFSQAFNINFNGWVGTISGSKSFEILTIPRYANFNGMPAITDITQTSLNLSWSANATCSYVNYYLNGEVVNTEHNISSTSHSFTFTNLSPNTTYTLSVRIWRKDSNLYTTSSNISITTLPISSLVTQDTFSLNIGDNLSLSFQNEDKNASTLKLSVEDDSGSWITINSAQVTVPINEATYLWHLSSYATTLYEHCTTKNEMNFRISCGVTLNGKYYENIYSGIMHVTNADPSFNAFTLTNTNTTITNLLGVTTSTIQNMGNFRVQIPSASKAIAQKSAAIVKYIAYLIPKGATNVVKTAEAVYSSTSQVNIDIGTYSTAGTYQICVFAVDSRQNVSSTIAKDCIIIPYHAPVTNINIYRMNGFEKEIFLELYSQYSRLAIGSTDKNSLVSIMYRYAEVGTSLPSSWKSITDYSSGITSVNATDSKLTYIRNTLSNYFIKDLSIEKSYNFEFKITDKVDSVIYSMTVEQGIPILGEFDDGHITIGMSPELDNSAKLQVASDILVTDTDGTKRMLLETLKNFMISSDTEPTNQIVGGIWNKTS